MTRIAGRRWCPDRTHIEGNIPAPGTLVAIDHAVWRIIDVQPRPRDLWDDKDRRVVEQRGEGAAPRLVVLRPASVRGDDPRARDLDRHIRAWPGVQSWDVYRDEHYPVCAVCGEPTPCREVMGERIAKQEMERMSRYETPGVCPHCEKVVTTRQRSMTFQENLEIPAGPPVTFHLSGNCYSTALQYERRWAAADHEHRKATLSCRGHVTNHNDGTYDCTAMADCPGPGVAHESYSVCACPGCHAKGQFGSLPSPSARRNGDTSDLFGDAA